MNTDSLTHALEKVISAPMLHARWLNTLSYLENCGARKIASCEHRTLVTCDMLQHAAEEFRHAYLLKRQIGKIISSSLSNYALGTLIGGFHALHYIDKLDLSICRMLKRKFFQQDRFKHAAYLLVTYAIEVRASTLYPLYQNILERRGFNISLKALIAEEDRHLADIVKALSAIENASGMMEEACHIEQQLFSCLMQEISAL